MHIRTVGELHDTINAQVDEIAELKEKLKASNARHAEVIYKFKMHRSRDNADSPTTRIQKLILHLFNQDLYCLKANKKTLNELASKFYLTTKTVRVEWSKIRNKKAVNNKVNG